MPRTSKPEALITIDIPPVEGRDVELDAYPVSGRLVYQHRDHDEHHTAGDALAGPGHVPVVQEAR